MEGETVPAVIGDVVAAAMDEAAPAPVESPELEDLLQRRQREVEVKNAAEEVVRFDGRCWGEICWRRGRAGFQTLWFDLGRGRVRSPPQCILDNPGMTARPEKASRGTERTRSNSRANRFLLFPQLNRIWNVVL